MWNTFPFSKLFFPMFDFIKQKKFFHKDIHIDFFRKGVYYLFNFFLSHIVYPFLIKNPRIVNILDMNYTCQLHTFYVLSLSHKKIGAQTASPVRVPFCMLAWRLR